ncbi:ABC transporter permease subunit [Alloiococcus sp. CFN-8]|uniref:ABC transporter permease subunit n=1 Tax=Alloiococcus sp. CFN-8 TaxID=3416081 RepID=UPI003CEDB70A
MNKLLSAEVHRLLKYRLYLIECFAFIVYPLHKIIFSDYGYEVTIDGFLFATIPFIGIGTAVVISQFIGEEYSCGAIRNKLSTGHTRNSIYLTELVLHSFASVNVLNLSVLYIIIAGLIRGWKFEFSFSTLFGYYLVCICTVLIFSALSVFVSMVNTSKVVSLIILLTLSFFFMETGSNSLSKLQHSEMRMPNSFELEEGYSEPMPNVLYLEGGIRTIHQGLLLINPYGQAVYEFQIMYDRYEEYASSKVMENPHIKIFLSSVVEITILTAIGLLVFKKKDIK